MMQLAELDRIFAQTNPLKTIRFRHGTCTEVGQDSACPALRQRCLDVGPATQPSIPGADGPCLRSRQLSAHKPRRLRDYPNRPAVRWSDFRFRPPQEKALGKQWESMFFRLERKHFSGFPRLWHQSCCFKFLAGNQARCLEVTRFGDALPGHLSFLLEVSHAHAFCPYDPAFASSSGVLPAAFRRECGLLLTSRRVRPEPPRGVRSHGAFVVRRRENSCERIQSDGANDSSGAGFACRSVRHFLVR